MMFWALVLLAAIPLAMGLIMIFVLRRGLHHGLNGRRAPGQGGGSSWVYPGPSDYNSCASAGADAGDYPSFTGGGGDFGGAGASGDWGGDSGGDGGGGDASGDSGGGGD